MLAKTVIVSAIGLTSLSAAFAGDQKPSAKIPRCEPVPKLLHYEVLDRESRFPHQGQIRLSFTIDAKGEVRDVAILESTDTWFNQLSVQSVLRWRYEPPLHPCRATTMLRFTAKD
jgi:TonB family protein